MNNSHTFKIAVLLASAISFLSCQKEQLLVNDIEGNYNIEKVVYVRDGRDSVVNYANGSRMFFDDCKLKAQKGAQQCDGYIHFEGQDRITFGYRPEKSGSITQMFFNLPDSDNYKGYGGMYEIEAQTDNTLTLFRYSYDEYMDKNIDFRMFLKK